MWAKHTITIGDNFYIGKYSQIECDAEIGNNVMMANFVALIGRHDHDYSEIGVPTRLAGKIRDADYRGQGLGEKVIIEWLYHPLRSKDRTGECNCSWISSNKGC